jgi:hypothetical protein
MSLRDELSRAYAVMVAVLFAIAALMWLLLPRPFGDLLPHRLSGDPAQAFAACGAGDCDEGGVGFPVMANQP